MLCPSCGAEVGDTIQLCAKCEEARLERIQSEANAKGPRSGISEALHESDVKGQSGEVDEQSDPAKRKNTLLLTLLFGAILVMVAVIAVFTLSGGRDSQTVTTAPATDKNSQPAPKAFRAAVRFAETQLRLESGFAMYRPGSRELEIGFYHGLSTKADPTEAIRAASLKTVQGTRADVLVTIRFRRATRSCTLNAIESFKVHLYKNGGGLPLGTDDTEFELAPQQNDTEQTAKSFTLNSLNCDLKPGAHAEGLLRGSRTIAVKDESMPASWELEFSLPIYFPPPPEIEYRSDMAQSVVALWDQKKSELSIGYYGEELLGPEREQLRAARSLSALPRYQPDAVVTFTLDKQQKYFTTAAVRTYGVTFYRSRAGKLDFPGSADSVNLVFVPSEQDKRLSGLSGALGEGGIAAGSFHGEVDRKLEDVDAHFRWDFRFNIPIMDIDAKGAPRGPEAAPTEVDTKGLRGKVSADGLSVDIRSVMALYYSATNDVGIGLYADDLSDEERKEIANKKVLSAYVNNKRPVMVILLDFGRDQKKADLNGLAAYTVYFYRSKVGFTFPGQYEVVSFRRAPEQFQPGEFRLLDGALNTGGIINVGMKSSGKSSSGPGFAWEFVINANLTEVK